jgi:hypothetical protein
METLNNSIDDSEANITRQLDHLHLEFDNLKMEKLSMPSGSQEFQKVLLQTGVEPEETEFRKRSHTVDSSYVRPKNHVHFSSKLTTTEPCKHGSSDDIHKRHGILRHHDGTRSRCNTYDSTTTEKEEVSATGSQSKVKVVENGQTHKNHENAKNSGTQDHFSGFRSIFRSKSKSESSSKSTSKQTVRKKDGK